MAQSEFESPRITQQEAAEMVELWTREHEGGDGTVDLRDVAEALHISEVEGRRLLARVRKEPEPVRTLGPNMTRMLRTLLLGLCMVYGTTFSIAVLQLIVAGTDLRPETKVVAVAVFLATLTLFWYYRRPITRFFGGLGRRIAQGKP